MRYLLLILFIVLIVFATRALRRLGQRDDGAPRDSAGGAAGRGEGAVMLACAHCGLHLPRNETLPGRDGGVYCSEAHRAAAEARDGSA